MQIPIMCPKCGSWGVDPIKPLRLRDLRHRLRSRILHRCKDCGWQGYIVMMGKLPPVVWVAIAAVVVILVIALIKI